MSELTVVYVEDPSVNTHCLQVSLENKHWFTLWVDRLGVFAGPQCSECGGSLLRAYSDGSSAEEDWTDSIHDSSFWKCQESTCEKFYPSRFPLVLFHWSPAGPKRRSLNSFLEAWTSGWDLEVLELTLQIAALAGVIEGLVKSHEESVRAQAAQIDFILPKDWASFWTERFVEAWNNPSTAITDFISDAA